MRSVNELAVQVEQQYRSGQAPCKRIYPVESNREVAQHVNDIFRALQGAFPAWRAAFPDDDSLKSAKATWVKALIDADVTDFEMIARGVRKARQSGSDFFPSVGKFISWCKPNASELGMPDADSAWSEANRHSHNVLDHFWSHPAVYAAGKGHWFEIRAGKYKKDQYVANYESLVAQVANGSVIEGPVADSTKLEYQSGGKTTTEEAKAAAAQALAELRKGFGL
jgi:hypothetical protein